MSNYQPPVGAYGQPGIDPGRTLGIVGLVLACTGILCGLTGIAGLVCSIIGYTKSKSAGYKNNLALAGIIVSIVLFVIGLIVTFTYTLPMYMNSMR